MPAAIALSTKIHFAAISYPPGGRRSNAAAPESSIEPIHNLQ
jgi:hypothetical protein